MACRKHQVANWKGIKLNELAELQQNRIYETEKKGANPLKNVIFVMYIISRCHLLCNEKSILSKIKILQIDTNKSVFEILSGFGI